MKPKSETLFHFTKSAATLRSILRSGFWPRYCLEDIEWLREDPTDNGAMSFPVVCFCDIPLARIEEHVRFYGNYGIGMTKEWALRSGLSPVHYIAQSSPFVTAFKSLGQLAIKTMKATKDSESLRNVRTLSTYMKPLSGTMKMGGAPVLKDFYQESEWRFVARGEDIEMFLSPEQHADPAQLKKANEMTREAYVLRFAPSDIRYIFVRRDADIPALVNFIQTGLGGIAGADLNLLTTRVTSLEDIARDW